MWKRFVQIMACPICNDSVELCVFKEVPVAISADHVNLARKLGLSDEDFNKYVEAGLLICHRCKKWFPITQGIAVLVPYITPVHRAFVMEFRERISLLPVRYDFPMRESVAGEQSVMDSFSSEWLEYDYDAVIWSMSYDDHENRFLSEVGFGSNQKPKVNRFLEIGCGLGITTFLAHKNFETDAVGVDLSLAVFQASRHYRMNPFLHFIQASAFHIPLRKEIADIVYSHGVLHHTYSTHEAFKAIVPYCSPGGLMYIWVYGTGSKKGSLLRRLTYMLERITRPIVGRHSSSPWSRIFLTLMACGYLAVNRFHFYRNPKMKKYNFKRALHAARDRFTPLYAYRQNYQEVSTWFQQAGFEEIQEVDWRTVPIADQDNYRRNTGVRGRLKK